MTQSLKNRPTQSAVVPASSPSPADVSHSPSPVIQFPRSSSPLTAFRDIVKGILNVVNETEDFNELSAIQHPDDAVVTYCQDSLQPSLIEDSLRSPFTLLEAFTVMILLWTATMTDQLQSHRIKILTIS